MKVAVCISGQLRKLHRTDINGLADHIGADVFIHTWEDETNPNLAKVREHFPNACLETEKYSDVFDHLPFILDEGIVTNRYYFAQFYTVMKSFHLCKDQGYDLIYKARTDVKMDPSTYNFEDKLADLENSIKRIPGTNGESPCAFAILQYANLQYVDFQDSFWSMNSAALDRLTQCSPSEIAVLASRYKFENQLVQGPSIWGRILVDLGINIITTSIGSGGPIKKNPELPVVPGHGEIG